MKHLPQIVELERRDPRRNMCRFYRLELERDLLGAVLALRSWGRIGTCGQTKVLAFSTDGEAQAELLRWERQKRRRGYVDRRPYSLRFDAQNAEIISA
ncbi:WGR domain-containing protein (plasmid) [Rhizobium sp. TH2]|uniref:WGR domain-containing protein n=1 Tax=Rhizobium sp. TH2 TaxID=2775403 RepID=UPI0021583F96|nr:WGR domain-containing protein [Rhizobium sp. TH2]UVC12229.1 WGR domain-containing protein [Rhizobium sp. TH2]